jgi:hypothetical protein
VVTDDALGSEGLSLAGADSSKFEIVGSELFLKAGVKLDFEAKASYAVTINVNDPAVGGSVDVSRSFTLSVRDVNEAPTAVSFTGATTSLAENASTTTRIKVANVVVADDALGSEVLSLAGRDASSFELVGTELFLKAGVKLDFETKKSLAVTVNVNDPSIGGSVDAQSDFTLAVSDVSNQPPYYLWLYGITSSIEENTSTATRINVVDIISVADDLEGTVVLSLTGPDAGAFERFGSGLYLKAGVTLDFETKPSYAVTVNAYDPSFGTKPTAGRSFVLSVKNLNEAPTALAFNNATTSLAENASTASHIKVADIAITDDALGSEALSLSGADFSKFEIAGSELFLRAGVTLDFETKASHSVTINANDPTVGSNPDTKRSFALTIADVTENIFIFEDKLTKSNVKHIETFDTGFDEIWLDRSIFKTLKFGAISSKSFLSAQNADKAENRDQRIIYDINSGKCYYDKDGKGDKRRNSSQFSTPAPMI